MDHKISIKALRKMPPGRPIKIEKDVDGMDGKKHVAVLWIHSSGPWMSVSKSYFDIETGDYLGEAI